MSQAFRSTTSKGRSIVGDRQRRSALLIVTAVIAACALATIAAGSTKGSTIGLRRTAVGNVLVAANRRTLYLFTADKAKTSACYGQCSSFWPPLIATNPSAGRGLKASLLGTTKRKGGRLQVTYGGNPLYFFAKDRKPGDLKGQGFVHFGGAWWVVSASGKKITAKP